MFWRRGRNAKAAEARAAEARAAEARAAEARATEAIVAETRAAEAKAAEARAAEARAAEARATEAIVAETRAAEAKAAEARAAEARAIEARVAETRAAEAKAAEARIAEARAVEAKAAKARAVETRAAEINAAEARVAEARATETKAAKARAAEPRVAETRAVKARIADTKTVGTSAAKIGIRDDNLSRKDLGVLMDAISRAMAAKWGTTTCKVHEHCDGSCSGPQITYKPLVSERNLIPFKTEQMPQKVDPGTVCHDEQWLKSHNFPHFEYEQLPKSPATMRLLLVKRAIFRAEIVQCDFVTAALDDHPAFIALSYNEGEPIFDTSILCDCKILRVTATLAAALKAYRSFVPCTKGILLWTDAVCINQRDEKELNSQIALKKKIYSQADAVYVHLGDIGNEWYQGFDLMTKLGFVYDHQQAPTADRSLKLDKIWNLYRLPSGHNPAWAQYQKIFESVWPWHSWILQEVAMGKEVNVMFGRFAFPWALFSQSFRFLQESRLLLPPTSTPAPVDFRNELLIRTSSVQPQVTGLDLFVNMIPFYLCQYCRPLNLTVASFVVPRNDPSLRDCDYSTIESLTTRPFEQLQKSAEQNCRLCCLIQQAVTVAYPAEAALPDVKCEIRKKVHRNFDNNTLINHRILQVLLHYGPPRTEMETPIVELLPVESDGAPGVFHGRRVDPDGIDYSLVKDWMHECQHNHGHTCDYSLDSRFEEIAPYLRVIDVKKGCLTRLPPGSRYVALSYVWGESNIIGAFATLRSNVNALTEPGSFDDVLSSSPSVISDTFDFVRNIGEQYLWIDRICIVQDDDEEKQSIINKMNLVYGSAFITVFAATGKDASTGLPGVRRNSRGCQQLINEIDLELELMVPLDLETFMKSVWATRGWTYQEFFFSKRRFIFIGGQVVYSCLAGNFREDVITPHLTPTQDFLWSGPTGWQPPMTLSKLEPVQQRLCFMEFVQAFSKRQLTYDNDVLNAFAGVVDYMANDLLFKTHFGLPLCTLDLDVLWHPRHFLQRRRGFPSWSWAGWKGPVLLARAGETLMPGIQHIRKRYTKRNAFLARLFFVPFYTYDEETQCFQLTSIDMNEFCKRLIEDSLAFYREMAIKDHKSALEALAAPVTPMSSQAQFPPIAREKNCSFDPRSWELKAILSQLNSPLPKYTISARPPPEAASRLTRQTLLLHTLTACILVSTLDQQGSRCKPPVDRKPQLSTTPCIYFYDENGSSIGLGWLCEESSYNRLVKICEESQDLKRPPYRLQVEVAFLSGPIRGNWRHKDEWSLESGLQGVKSFTESLMLQFGFGHKTPTQMANDPNYAHLDGIIGEKPWEGISLDADEEDMGEDDLKYCQVMLLCNIDSSGEYDFDYAKSEGDPWQVKERIGLGEIREDVIAGLRGIAWRDVLLQ